MKKTFTALHSSDVVSSSLEAEASVHSSLSVMDGMLHPFVNVASLLRAKGTRRLLLLGLLSLFLSFYECALFALIHS